MTTAVEKVRNILIAAPAVAALIADRVSPLQIAQGIELPAVTLTRSSVTPMGVLTGPSTLKATSVLVDAIAMTYDEADAITEACFTALEANVDCSYVTTIDVEEPDVSETRITQEFIVWT